MTNLAVHRLRIERDVVCRIKRVLKGKGKLNVRLGQTVVPPDIIGTAHLSSGFRTLNLSESLNVAADKINKYLF